MLHHALCHAIIGVEHQLRNAKAIAQVDKDEVAVVAVAIHPTIEPNNSANMLCAQLTTRV
jgi:hypothetical protein